MFFAVQVSHLSWGALLHRFDDGNSVFLFQGKAITSIAWPYLENMFHISKIPNQQTKTLSQSAHTAKEDTGADRKHTLYFAHSYEKKMLFMLTEV